jgi:phosphatidyl-myo-inositol alpha-mannosyltransferase
VKIALVSAYDYPYPGGVTEHVAALDTHLRRRGHDVVIIAPSAAEPSTLAPNVRPVSGVMEIPANGSTCRLGVASDTGAQVQAYLRREMPDIVHIHEPLQPLVPLMALRYSHAVNIGTFHAFGETKMRIRVAGRMLGGVMNRLHGRIAVSTLARSFAQTYLPGDYTIIPNGVDVARFAAPLPPIESMNDGRPTILFVGRYNEPRKGFQVLLEAFPYVRAACPNVRLVVAGKGDPAPFADQLPDDRDAVRFVGMVSTTNLPRYYQSATVYCSPATGGESFGIVLLEAMAAGTPVVASDNPGYASVVTHEHDGLLVPPEDPGMLAATLIRLLIQPATRTQLVAAGRDTAARYDWPLVAGRIEEYYQQTLAQVAEDKRATFSYQLSNAMHKLVSDITDYGTRMTDR